MYRKTFSGLDIVTMGEYAGLAVNLIYYVEGIKSNIKYIGVSRGKLNKLIQPILNIFLYQGSMEEYDDTYSYLRIYNKKYEYRRSDESSLYYYSNRVGIKELFSFYGNVNPGYYILSSRKLDGEKIYLEELLKTNASPNSIIEFISKGRQNESDYAFSIILKKVRMNIKEFSPHMKIFSCKSNLGMVRQNNEDACLISSITVSKNGYRKRYQLLIVADGVGGAQKGEIASREAITSSFINIVSSIVMNSDIDFRNIIENAIISANQRVLEMRLKMHTNMSTTLTIALIDDKDIYIGHVGDSRAYIFTPQFYKQLTRDHKLVEDLVERGIITREQAKYHPQRNVITSAIGMQNPRIDINYYPNMFIRGTILLLCSDGLTDLVEETYIGRILCSGLSINKKVNRLIEEANRRGGRDNITIALLQYLES